MKEHTRETGREGSREHSSGTWMLTQQVRPTSSPLHKYITALFCVKLSRKLQIARIRKDPTDH